jgi:hypothetical protein
MTNDEFWATVTPALLNFLSVAVPAILGYIAYVIRGWVAKVTEAKDREALHSALQTGVNAAEQKYGIAGDKKSKAEFAADYVKKSVPDALANLNPPQEVLIKLAMAKREELETKHAQNPPC